MSNPGSRWSEKPSDHPVHRQRSFLAIGTTANGQECRFSIYLRENIRDVANYSCGILYLPRGATKLTLARYNGSNHKHGIIHYKPHIHQATEHAIATGQRPENIAEETTRYRTINGALACLVDDFHVIGITTNHDLPDLFNGH